MRARANTSYLLRGSALDSGSILRSARVFRPKPNAAECAATVDVEKRSHAMTLLLKGSWVECIWLVECLIREHGWVLENPAGWAVSLAGTARRGLTSLLVECAVLESASKRQRVETE